MRNILRRLAPVVSVAALTLGAAAKPSPAADFTITPTRVELSQAAASGTITVVNTGAEAIRFELTAFTWDERPDGRMTLDPTEDLIVFPTVFTLEPKQRRTIRVGRTKPGGPVEQTYRLFLEELPSGRPSDGTLRVRTRMGIPVFLAPQASVRRTSLAGPEVQDGTVLFAIRNDGTVHALPRRLTVIALGADGTPLMTEDLQAWYVLAGRARNHAVALPAASCGAVRRVRLELATPDGPLAREAHTPDGACGAGSAAR